ncbi:LolA-like outer membrane lipoprotein chaperone [Sulfurimonas sp.]
MKKNFLLTLLASTTLFASLNSINSFEADFTQNIVDEKGKTIKYTGHVLAKKPQYAFWQYSTPVKKNVYILPQRVVIVEPELEQAIVKFIRSDFDFFNMLKNAKKISSDVYEASFNNAKFKITMKNSEIVSISYKDEFENDVTIAFSKQKQNLEINDSKFIPNIPIEYDVIRD